LLGAVGRPDVPPGVLERGLLLRLRFELDLYVNLRPVKLYPGVSSPLADVKPDDIDLVVVRENTEGVYVGAGGAGHRGGAGGGDTGAGVERALRYAAAKARERAGRLTLVHKTNVLVHAGDLWQRAARAVAAETGVALDYAHADAACLYLVNDPGRFDVIVTDTLLGDILNDLGAAIAGGLGTAASANLNPDSSPSLFEPVHGSAPDIAGTGRPTPVPAVLSASLLLDHLGEREAAAAVEAGAVAALPGAAGYSTQALGDRIPPRLAGGRGRGRARSRCRGSPARGCGILDTGARGPDRHRRRGRRVPGLTGGRRCRSHQPARSRWTGRRSTWPTPSSPGR